MLFAIAALFLQFAPAIHALPDVDLGSVAPAVKSAPAPADAKPDQPKASTTASAKINSAGAASGTLTAVSLETAVENSLALSAIRVPDYSSAKPEEVISAEGYPRRNWLLLSIAQHSAATFDAYSTRQAIATGATETVMSPAVKAAPPASIIVAQRCRCVERRGNGSCKLRVCRDHW